MLMTTLGTVTCLGALKDNLVVMQEVDPKGLYYWNRRQNGLLMVIYFELQRIKPASRGRDVRGNRSVYLIPRGTGTQKSSHRGILAKELPAPDDDGHDDDDDDHRYRRRGWPKQRRLCFVYIYIHSTCQRRHLSFSGRIWAG